LVFRVALVPNEHYNDVRVCVVPDLLQPLRHVVVHQQSARNMAVVLTGDILVKQNGTR
jgi:hypothetical protein